MYLDNRQKEVVKNGIKDYEFIKNEIETKMNLKNCTLEDIQAFLTKFNSKDLEITNLENYNDDYGYLDFIYKDINTCVGFDKEVNKDLHVSSTFEIYDREKMEYIIEDFCSKEEYLELLNKTKEQELQDLVQHLKYCDSHNLKADYDISVKDLIIFLKENW